MIIKKTIALILALSNLLNVDSQSSEFSIQQSEPYQRVKTVTGSAYIHYNKMIARDGEILKITLRKGSELYLQKFDKNLQMVIDTDPIEFGDKFVFVDIIEFNDKIYLFHAEGANNQYKVMAHEIDFNSATIKGHQTVNSATLEIEEWPKVGNRPAIPRVGVTANVINGGFVLYFFQKGTNSSGSTVNFINFDSDLKEEWSNSLNFDSSSENIYIGDIQFDKDNNLYGLSFTYDKIDGFEQYRIGMPLLNKLLFYISADGGNEEINDLSVMDGFIPSLRLFHLNNTVYVAALKTEDEYGPIDYVSVGEFDGSEIKNVKEFEVHGDIKKQYASTTDTWNDIRHRYGNTIGMQISHMESYDDGTLILVFDKEFYSADGTTQSTYSTVLQNYETILAVIKNDECSFHKLPISQATGQWGLGIGNYYQKTDNHFYTFCLDMPQNANLRDDQEPEEYQLGFSKGKEEYVAYSYDLSKDEVRRVKVCGLKEDIGKNFILLNQNKMVQIDETTFAFEIEDEKRKNSKLVKIEISE